VDGLLGFGLLPPEPFAFIVWDVLVYSCSELVAFLGFM
jgi:hypothetical protein